jgi:hypothetical protein
MTKGPARARTEIRRPSTSTPPPPATFSGSRTPSIHPLPLSTADQNDRSIGGAAPGADVGAPPVTCPSTCAWPPSRIGHSRAGTHDRLIPILAPLDPRGCGVKPFIPATAPLVPGRWIGVAAGSRSLLAAIQGELHAHRFRHAPHHPQDLACVAAGSDGRQRDGRGSRRGRRDAPCPPRNGRLAVGSNSGRRWAAPSAGD